MTRVLLILFLLTGHALIAQPAPLEGDVLPMGPFQLPARDDFTGKWIRYDGTYALEVLIAPVTGDLSSKYFNPDPINVESTSLEGEGETLIFQIVLRDEGYPGSSYRLEFLPRHDVLLGYYVRPDQEPQQVYFTRTN